MILIRRRPRAGFTLLELVLVLMILAALAGLVISQVAQIGRTTDMAFTAKTQADVAENLQLHFVLQKRYPTHMDSLLVDTDSDGVGDAVFLPVDTDGDGQQNYGLPDSGPHLDEALSVVTLPNDDTQPLYGARRSLTRCGFEAVMDHDPAASLNSNMMGVLERSLAGDIDVAAVDPTIEGGQKVLRQLFPKRIDPTSGDVVMPANTVVVALGVGPRSSCIPDTMLNAPLYPGNDGTYYGHYVAFFECYASGERANLVGVSDSYGRLPVYSIQQYNESLPNNQRRG